MERTSQMTDAFVYKDSKFSPGPGFKKLGLVPGQQARIKWTQNGVPKITVVQMTESNDIETISSNSG